MSITNGHRSDGFVGLRTPMPAISKSRSQELSVRGAAARTVETSNSTSDASDPRAVTSAFQDWTISQSVYGLKNQYVRLPYRLPFEILEIVELLAEYNPDYSQAVENIKTLANPGHDLIVEGQKREVQRVKDDLELMSSRVGGAQGIDGVVDKLLKQGAVYGAMAGEWVVDADYTHVVDFMEVNPKSIRFFWLIDEARFVPFQRVNLWQAAIAEDRGQEVIFDCVRLNENTFFYAPFNSATGSPYGLPPFLASLHNISIQRDMVFNMAQIVKKLGLLGMIDMSVEQLSPRAGESEAEFQTRAGKYLDDYVQVLKQTVRDGGIVHYDDVTTQTHNVTGNAAGATNIFKQNEELVFSGLKSMPSVQGRSYCVVPETRVLTADLEWVQAGTLCLSDELVGFDEDLGKGRGSGSVARMKRASVEVNRRIELSCVKVVTDHGEITVSKQHPFVAVINRTVGRGWREAVDLSPGDKLIWFGEPWETDRSYDAGYLAGMFDGEGSIGRSGSGKNGTVTLAQLPGVVLDETIMALKRLNFEITCGDPNPQSGVCHLRVLGGKSETLRLLGQVRPHRLLAKAPMAWEGASLRNGGSINQIGRKDVYATVLRVEDVGVKEVVALQTSSRTFISEGLLSHNSTTETYAGVAYDIILRNTAKFQRAAKRFIESGYWIQATLQGETPTKISLQFKSNKSLHRLQDAQAEQAEIINSLLLWVMGILDQQDVAQRHGQSEPAIDITEPDFIPRLLTAIGQIQGAGGEGGQDGSGAQPPEESVGTNV